jgi:nucleotide-binding universal stress UspA family protein
MIQLRNLLCPVDFSTHSQHALRHAMSIARRHDSEVTLLHVEDMLLGAARADLSRRAAFLPKPDDELRAFAEEAGYIDLQHVRFVTRSGDAVAGIIEYAVRKSSDLIVMGTRGRSGLARAVLGSVTERVLREAPCPVMTIPPAASGLGLGELEPFDPILCASDFSPSCRKALDLAVWMAQEGDARLILLHAMQWPSVLSGMTPLPLALDLPTDRAVWQRQALERLRLGLPTDAPFRCRPEEMVVAGPPTEAILRCTADAQVSLIVMGVHSRGAIDRMLFGSTTRQVIQSATCPVLSIRAHRDDKPWTSAPQESRQPVGALP